MDETSFFGLVARHWRWGLTWKGWIGACMLAIAFLVLATANVYSFLAINKPLRGDILVVEGWLSDEALAQAAKEFGAYDYQLLVTTGGPLARGSFLSRYKSYAQLAAATLMRLGVDAERIKVVPAPRVRKDRTWASALALKRWLKEAGLAPGAVDVLTMGPHARRTRLLFEKALEVVRVGVIAVEGQDYTSERWWTSSAGVRTVIGESIAYLYARFAFSP